MPDYVVGVLGLFGAQLILGSHMLASFRKGLTFLMILASMNQKIQYYLSLQLFAQDSSESTLVLQLHEFFLPFLTFCSFIP